MSGERESLAAARAFRFALDDYIAEKLHYDKAREDYGDQYDWDYFGATEISAMEKASERLDEAFVAAVEAISG